MPLYLKISDLLKAYLAALVGRAVFTWLLNLLSWISHFVQSLSGPEKETLCVCVCALVVFFL